MRSAAILFFLVTSINAYAVEQEPLIHYGENHVFTIEIPDGWFNDAENAKIAGLPYLLRPKHEKNFNYTYIYAAGDGSVKANTKLDTVVQRGIDGFKERYGNIWVQKGIVFHNKENKYLTGKVKLVEYANIPEKFGKYKESVFYIQAHKSVVIIVFSSKSKSDYDHLFKDFEKVINSFYFVSDNPKSVLKK